MLGIIKDFLSFARFDKLAWVHDDNSMRDGANDFEIMANK